MLPPRQEADALMRATDTTGECCDNCTRRTAVVQSPSTEVTASIATRRTGGRAANDAAMEPEQRFARSNWRAFLVNVKRKEREVGQATRLLEHWRRLTWWKSYSHAPFGPAGILSDDDITTLSTRQGREDG